MSNAVSYKGASGRTYSVKRLTARERFRLFEAVPNELVSNGLWLTWALMAASVREIDDVPIPFPSKKVDIENIVDQVDEDMTDLIDKFMQEDMDALERAKAQAKNSDGTQDS